MGSETKSRRPGRRLWWLVVILLCLLNVLAWQRKPIAAWISRLAIARAGQGDAASARSYLELATAVSHQAPETQLALARLQRHEGNMIEFRRHLKRARYLGIEPQLAEREHVLALAQGGQMSVAAPQLVNLLETAGGEEAEICEAFALGYMRMRDFGSALMLLHAWAEEHPEDARPYAWIGQIQAELRNAGEAEAAFRKALQLDAHNASAALGMGQLLLDSKRSAEAIAYFEIAANDPSVGPAAAVGWASGLLAQSRQAEASQVLESALQRFPEDYRLLAEKAGVLIEQGDHAQAEALLRPQVEAGSLRRELRYSYAVALRGLGRTDEAAEHFAYAATAAEQAAAANQRIPEVAADPANAQLRCEIGEAHLSSGNIEDGLLWLQSALEVDPRHQPSHRALAEYYETKVDDHPRFISLFQRHRTLAGPKETH